VLDLFNDLSVFIVIFLLNLYIKLALILHTKPFLQIFFPIVLLIICITYNKTLITNFP